VSNSKHPLYNTWKQFRARCNNPNNPDYASYGGRGITVAPEWNDFETFKAWAEVNLRKQGETLHRIDNDGPYSPDNCRWAPWSVQMRARRRSKPSEIEETIRHAQEAAAAQRSSIVPAPATAPRRTQSRQNESTHYTVAIREEMDSNSERLNGMNAKQFTHHLKECKVDYLHNVRSFCQWTVNGDDKGRNAVQLSPTDVRLIEEHSKGAVARLTDFEESLANLIDYCQQQGRSGNMAYSMRAMMLSLDLFRFNLKEREICWRHDADSNRKTYILDNIGKLNAFTAAFMGFADADLSKHVTRVEQLLATLNASQTIWLWMLQQARKGEFVDESAMDWIVRGGYITDSQHFMILQLQRKSRDNRIKAKRAREDADAAKRKALAAVRTTATEATATVN